MFEHISLFKKLCIKFGYGSVEDEAVKAQGERAG